MIANHDLDLIQSLRRLSKFYALVATIYVLGTISAIWLYAGWGWLINAISAVAFTTLSVVCHRKQKALVIREINRKFGVTDE